MADDFVRLAYVIDGEVVELFKVDQRLGAIITSNPIIVDITDNENVVAPGMKYDENTKQFSE
jgi:hypothetical protein